MGIPTIMNGKKLTTVMLVVIGLMYISLEVVRERALLGPPSPRSTENSARTTMIADFDLTQFGGPKKKFSELAGRVTLLNFWATWCESCLVEMPSMLKLRAQFKDQGFVFLPINVDERPEAVLPKAIKQFGFDFPIFTDSGGQLADRFEVSAIPLTLIVDSHRKILLRTDGENNWNSEEVQSMVRAWLKL